MSEMICWGLRFNLYEIGRALVFVFFLVSFNKPALAEDVECENNRQRSSGYLGGHSSYMSDSEYYKNINSLGVIVHVAGDIRCEDFGDNNFPQQDAIYRSQIENQLRKGGISEILEAAESPTVLFVSISFGAVDPKVTKCLIHSRSRLAFSSKVSPPWDAREQYVPSTVARRDVAFVTPKHCVREDIEFEVANHVALILSLKKAIRTFLLTQSSKNEIHP